MTEHTPGPWEATKTEQCSSHAWFVRPVSGGLIIADVQPALPWGGPSPQVGAADAKLIACAPELLEALEALVEAHDEVPSMLTPDLWEEARAAIKRAKEG